MKYDNHFQGMTSDKYFPFTKWLFLRKKGHNSAIHWWIVRAFKSAIPLDPYIHSCQDF